LPFDCKYINCCQLIGQQSPQLWVQQVQQLGLALLPVVWRSTHATATATATAVVFGCWLLIPFELNKPDYLLWGCFRSSFASSSTPAGCLLQLEHGLDEAARGAKSG
jgi:hypothetical protein